MKKSLALFAALTLFAAAPALAAKGDMRIGLRCGPSVPTDDFSTVANAGVEGGLAARFMTSERVGVGVDVAYHAWSGSDAANAQLAAFIGPGWSANFDAIQTTAHMRYDSLPGGGVSPYAELGWG